MYRFIQITLLLFTCVSVMGQSPKVHWDFEDLKQRSALETISGIRDTIEGNFESITGVAGQGIHLDGFTACVKRDQPGVVTGDANSIEAWIALGNYPWNWCPILTNENNEVKGYRLMMGPLGQVSLECAIGEQWVSCTSENDAIPLRTWMHVVGVYRTNEDMQLFINGEMVSKTQINGNVSQTSAGYLLGMVKSPEKPSDIHRVHGTIAAYYGIDGILDEIKVYDEALSASQIKNKYQEINYGQPDIAPRRLPTIENHPGRFGAYYTKLKYYPGWDNLWPVDQDPDIVVTFDESPIKLIFWRGIRYGASWVSENENWMSDQSVEAWGVGTEDNEGCFEHMQDRHCRYSHVRIIENTPARVVIHWRYAPTSAYLSTWRPDPKTGWECWIDEYYYIYPDATAIRKVSWKKGSLGFPRQFQETLALLHPGQIVSDLLEKDFALVADYEGNTGKQSFVEDPGKPPYGPFSWDKTYDFTIQQYGFKSEHKPFICFEPENNMWLRNGKLSAYDRAAGCNHFPVGQARCDGRTTLTSDRPSHCTSFPISEPVIHEKDDRYFWNGLYGMNDMDLDEIIHLGRSWAYAPEMTSNTKGIEVLGYDRSERCYQVVNSDKKSINLSIKGQPESPLINPAIVVKNWNHETATVKLNSKENKDTRIGIHHELDGTDLRVFLFMESTEKVEVEILNN